MALCYIKKKILFPFVFFFWMNVIVCLYFTNNFTITFFKASGRISITILITIAIAINIDFNLKYLIS